MSASTSYRIEIQKKYLKIWRSFESEIPEAMERCKQFLMSNPEDRLRSGGKLKKLKGAFAGILQYDVTDGARVWYVVDRPNRIVRIRYIGHHP